MRSNPEVSAALRQLLGPVAESAEVPLDSSGHSIGMLRFEDQPCDGATTFVTTGLSSLPWHTLNHELLMCLWRDEFSREMQLVLEFVARALAGGLEPLQEGDVLPPAGPLSPATSMVALYVCSPRYFPEALEQLEASGGRTVRLLWLVPLHATEVEFVVARGSAELEARLAAANPDLLSLLRPPIA